MSGYSFELHRQVDAIQMGTHNICLYKDVDKKCTGCILKTTELLDSAFIGVCAVIRSNTVSTYKYRNARVLFCSLYYCYVKWICHLVEEQGEFWFGFRWFIVSVLYCLSWFVCTSSWYHWQATQRAHKLKQRRFNVNSTSWRWINVESALFQRCVSAGYVLDCSFSLSSSLLFLA